MRRAPLTFPALLRAANPSAHGDTFDLEAALTKAKLRARVAGEALRNGSQAQRGRALAQLAHVFTLLGGRNVARQDRLIAGALQLTRSDPATHMHVLLAAAMVDFTRSDYQASLARLDAALAAIADQPSDGLWFLPHVRHRGLGLRDDG